MNGDIRTAVALGAVLVLLVLSAGCGDYVPNRDVIVVKLAPDGSMEWMKVLDTGFDDDALSIAELGGGSLLVGGQSSRTKYYDYYARLVRLTPRGEVVWSREFDGPLSGGITTLVPGRDNGTVAATLYGQVLRVTGDGTTVWEVPTDIAMVWSAAPAEDGGVVIAGQKQDLIPLGSGVDYGPDGTITLREARPDEGIPTPGCTVTMVPGVGGEVPVTMCTGETISVFQASVVRLDREGNVSWERSFGAYGMESAWSIVATGNGTFLISAYGRADPYHSFTSENILYAALLDGNGSVIWAREIEQTDYFLPAALSRTPQGYRVIVPNMMEKDGSIDIRPEVVDLDGEGGIVRRLPLDASPETIETRDGGFVSVGFGVNGGDLGFSESVYGRSAGFHLLRFSGNGTLERDQKIPGVTANYVRKVIQTSDGGYAVLLVKENP
ncbi:hypothetical protein J2741_001437 [Methanolinea mesophila]|uniref:hypothetical protein n=1 Tax=Methanolinea mesophila TaxID=547055 RepID=UPI001AE13832|nr:hypothetical protein [Methanolinea mesophila]MBP1928890.1 hypothetical protein [Methanolinea mesophila]